MHFARRQLLNLTADRRSSSDLEHDMSASYQPRKNGLKVNGQERDTPGIKQTNQSTARQVKEELSPTRQN